MVQNAQAFNPLTMLQSAATAQVAAAAVGGLSGRKTSAVVGGPIHHTSQMNKFRLLLFFFK